jgi:hypothetical protein
MANLSSDQDAGATEPIDPELPQPATHGQVHVSDGHSNPKALAAQMKQHLAEHVQHLSTTAAYNMTQKGAAGVTGQSSGGSFAPGGASGGADYQTTDVGGTGDADSGGASGD